jgi:hypothetical protein
MPSDYFRHSRQISRLVRQFFWRIYPPLRMAGLSDEGGIRYRVSNQPVFGRLRVRHVGYRLIAGRALAAGSQMLYLPSADSHRET